MHLVSREKEDAACNKVSTHQSIRSKGVGFEGFQLSCSPARGKELHWWPLEGGGLGIE